MIIFLFCYKSSFCSPILKLSISKYSSVTKVQFVHPYQNLQFWNIDQISILLKKFILFTHIQISILFKEFNLFTHIQISILLKEFNLFIHIESFNFQLYLLQKFNSFTNNKTLIFLILIKFLFCYKSSICSPISKLAFLIYWSNFYFVKKVQFVHPN